MTDTEFLAAFEAATLPRPDWTHEAHVRMAYLYLSAEGASFETARERIREGIRRYNAALGNHAGYHDTMTIAFARLIQDRLRRDPVSAATFPAFRAAHPDLFVHAVILRYYSRPYLFSPMARERFVEPDLEPLPPVEKSSGDAESQTCGSAADAQELA